MIPMGSKLASPNVAEWEQGPTNHRRPWDRSPGNVIPQKIPATAPATIAVTRPAAAPAPEVTPNPKARGNATMATVRPATISKWREPMIAFALRVMGLNSTALAHQLSKTLQ